MDSSTDPLIMMLERMGELIAADESDLVYERISRAAIQVAGEAAAAGLVSGPLWDAGGDDLLTSFYAFKTGVSADEVLAFQHKVLGG